MGEESVTYSEVQVFSSQRQRTANVSESKGTMCSGHPGCSAPPSSWKLISVILGIICLGLLVSVGILATKLTEPCSGNFTSSQETDQKGLFSGNSGIPSLPTKVQGWKCHPCEDNWHQHGENCYSISNNMSPWEDCEVRCSVLLSSFLKLETEKEMDFVKKLSMMQCQKKKIWISSYYNSSHLESASLDGSAFTVDQHQLTKPDTANNICEYINNGQLLRGNCKDRGHCICKKTTYGN